MPLTNACGHHCGIITAGRVTHEGHCGCKECKCPDAGRLKTIILK